MISLLPFAPFERFTIKTTLNQKGIVDRLLSFTENKKALRLTTGNKPFEGVIERDEFKINKQHTRSDYFPIAFGHVSHVISYKNIDITLRYSIAYYIGLLLWIPCLFYLSGGIPPYPENFNWWIPTVLSVLSYIVFTLLFKIQAHQLKKDVIAIFYED